ncbi:terminase large subunit (plasmid) [Komagataeibacter nataicola]|uniref:terminase large subunit n=1 Tax=Komagataeibacter nataicola TaxID=265960 RepID=UPI0028AC8B6A|nr:terminase large subunit [Komagataeibacter nataicola]WNM07289.1 terminase large subunit [Komagataeibacter nataicola]
MTEVTRLYSYAYEVCEGKIDVCHEVKLACQRSISDLKASEDPDFPYYFDPKDGIKFERFAARFRHLEGELAGEPFILMPWQLWAFAQILGWRHKSTGHRRFKTAHIEVPRGNGKSFMASVYAIYALSCDGVQGPQVYSAATSQRQARIVFDVARDLCANEPKKFIQGFLGLEIRAHDIQLRKRKDGFLNRGIFRPLCADGNRLDGLNISCAIVDELHAIKKRLVWDKLITGAGKRPSTLVIAITTAGMSLESIGYEQNSYCRKVLNGDIDAPSFWGCIWKADAGDDPYCVETLRKANPCWDAHQDHEQVLATMEKARLVPAERAGYLTLHLNQWLANGDSWLDLDRLVRCRDTLNIEDFKDLPCYVGIDMAKVTDMAAVVQCFYRADKLYVFPHYFLPSETIANSNNSQYHHWQEQGTCTQFLAQS